MGVSTMRCFCTIGRRSAASLKIAVATTAEPRPMTRAQRNSLPVGDPRCGRDPTLKEKVPKPVRLSSPTKIRAPTPADSNPGTSTSSIMGPPKPAISIRRKAPTMGEPRRVAMAAKLPATPITTTAIGGASRLNRCTARTPRPLPIAIRGASGPKTAPRLSVAKAAAMMPINSTGCTGPPALKPSEGSWPPVPGRK